MHISERCFMVWVYTCLQQMETNASINLSSSGALCALHHDPHTKKTLSFDTHSTYSYPHTHITLCHRITEDNFPVIWSEWSLRFFSICSAHLALGMTRFRLHVSTRIIENAQINWSDTRADLYPWPCADCNYPSPAVGSLETSVQGLHPVLSHSQTMQDHRARPEGETKHFRRQGKHSS